MTNLTKEQVIEAHIEAEKEIQSDKDWNVLLGLGLLVIIMYAVFKDTNIQDVFTGVLMWTLETMWASIVGVVQILLN